MDLRIFRTQASPSYDCRTDQCDQARTCIGRSSAFLWRKTECISVDRSIARPVVHFPDEPRRQKGKYRLQKQQMDMVRCPGDIDGSNQRTIRQAYNEGPEPDVRTELVQFLSDDHHVHSLRPYLVPYPSQDYAKTWICLCCKRASSVSSLATVPCVPGCP